MPTNPICLMYPERCLPKEVEADWPAPCANAYEMLPAASGYAASQPEGAQSFDQVPLRDPVSNIDACGSVSPYPPPGANPVE